MANQGQDPEMQGWRTGATRDVNRNLAAELQQGPQSPASNSVVMANRGYDVVVDVDQEV
jgi:starch phosphorylase